MSIRLDYLIGKTHYTVTIKGDPDHEPGTDVVLSTSMRFRAPSGRPTLIGWPPNAFAFY